ncbi:bifunctional adenosylcobinamide kinase/adenosylcobinamide-phosphate guanylyltransferase [Methylocystis bryophila]|uniref:Bifunctional adenosylcobalamin biosynthesis protein n=1 Tax=Methylocystis bryophila TaxID=655015 RepID=A0A1W6MSU2_9HYPH|nr:bifunctional adenosylcobinamide kinase/adenosylcobinamide-phosphate guanylyltransferase [Methylocystis bryophila]ARN80596.1 bifunctional adenosylcobinamide kinase/adenosylcobinamide-phosphate guanylyltransferase [Methylocystis bryophila]BDV40649.1 adenosylcobinamide kinase/adenosylcobinamide phosphate guanyltransferase [Methylocystis bryophila]
MKDDGSIAVNPQLRLVLGGARSGKSAFAESLIAASPPPWIYLATAEALDEEMAARIDKHQARRDWRWQTIEAPHRLCEALAGAPEDAPVLIDCLSLWLTNRLLAGANLDVEIDALVEALASRKVLTVAVSSEVGMTIVPENALARAFRDAAGELHQAVARVAGSVTLTVAGCPLQVKG